MLADLLHAREPGSLAEWAAVIVALVVGVAAAGAAVYAAKLAWKASESGERTALRVSSFQHTDRMYAAMRRHAKLVPAGAMPRIVAGWNPTGIDTDAQAATFEYLDALEMLFFAVEEGAADPRIVRRFVQPLLDHPHEILEAITTYRERGGDAPGTYESIQRALTKGSLVIPLTGRRKLWQSITSWFKRAT